LRLESLDFFRVGFRLVNVRVLLTQSKAPWNRCLWKAAALIALRNLHPGMLEMIIMAAGDDDDYDPFDRSAAEENNVPQSGGQSDGGSKASATPKFPFFRAATANPVQY